MSVPIQVLTLTVPANGNIRQICAGASSFKILAATGTVAIKGSWGAIDQCQVGQGIKFDDGTPLNDVTITDLSGATNTLRVIFGNATFIDNITGTVSLTNAVAPTSGSFAASAVSVGTASALLLAANPARKYFLFQNTSPSANVYLNFGAASGNTFLKVGPGSNYEPPVIPTGAIYALADVAATPGVLVTG